MTLVTGATLAHRQLLVPLGQGGAGSVWVAREQSPASGKERLIAVKVLRPEFASLSNFRAMFLEEGQLAKSIEHENVVQVFDVFEHEGVLSIAMEWVEGESLDALFVEATRRRPIPKEMAVRIIADTAKGLHAAHELKGWDGELAGIVHRDVSPHNILIGVGGQIKVADFGIAKAADGSGMDFGDTPHGKYGYLSPEQARGQAVDRRSDVFSLGVVLYELTTGKRLFQGEDRHHTLGLVMQCKVPRPSEVAGNYPPALEAIVLKALSNKPNERHQSADELRIALEKYLVQERTLVSTGSVSALLKRVLGQRLQARREAINEALIATTGHANSALLPETSLLTGMSQSSEVTAPRERLLSSHPSASETPHAVSHSQTSMPALAPRVRRSTKRTVAIGGGAAIAVFALMLGIGKMLQDDAAVTPRAGAATPGAAAPAVEAQDDPDRPQVEGVRLDDLPVEVQEERAKRRAAARRRVAPAPAPPAAKAPDWLKQAQGGDDTAAAIGAAQGDPTPKAAEPAAEPEDESNDAVENEAAAPDNAAAPEPEPPADSSGAEGDKPKKVIDNPYLKAPGF